MPSCEDARACLDAALVGSAKPATGDAAANDAGPDAPQGHATTDAPPVADDASTDPDATTRAQGFCVRSVPFASATCKSCMDTSCCAESANCGKSPACLALLACISDCRAGDAPCEQACKSARASSTIAAFDNLRACRNTSCDSTCPGF